MQTGNVAQDQLSIAYAEHANAILRHCHSRVRSKEDAEELVQDTFVNAYNYLEQGKKVENLKAFLFRIANNLIVDRVRKQKNQKEKEVSLDLLHENGFTLTSSYGTEMVQRKLDMEHAILALRECTEEDQLIFALRYVDGLKPGEIAALLDLSTNSVSVRLHRISRKISSLFEEGETRHRAGIRRRRPNSKS